MTLQYYCECFVPVGRNQHGRFEYTVDTQTAYQEDMKAGHDLNALVLKAAGAKGVRRGELGDGDVLLLYTQNSLYTVRKIDTNQFAVSGGWFDANHGREVVTSIVGCTWGGSSIHRDFVASCGMRIEFGNRVLTSVLKRVVRVPAALLN